MPLVPLQSTQYSPQAARPHSKHRARPRILIRARQAEGRRQACTHIVPIRKKVRQSAPPIPAAAVRADGPRKVRGHATVLAGYALSPLLLMSLVVTGKKVVSPALEDHLLEATENARLGAMSAMVQCRGRSCALNVTLAQQYYFGGHGLGCCRHACVAYKRQLKHNHHAFMLVDPLVCHTRPCARAVFFWSPWVSAGRM